MVAPLVPLVIAGVRIAAPIAAKYFAGKITKKAALKATEKGAKRVKKLERKNAEKAGKVRDKERNKSVAQEIKELQQTGVGKNMTPKQLKDRVMLNRKDAKIPEPKPGYSKTQRDYAKANKVARQKQIDNATVTTEKGVKVTRYPPRDKVEKDPTARPRRYLSPRGEPVGGMKKGGAVKVKKCRMDGIALRGKTRAKERSK